MSQLGARLSVMHRTGLTVRSMVESAATALSADISAGANRNTSTIIRCMASEPEAETGEIAEHGLFFDQGTQSGFAIEPLNFGNE